MNTTPFFEAVKEFYLATLKKMFKKFPFGDTILKDLGIQPQKTKTYTVLIFIDWQSVFLR